MRTLLVVDIDRTLCDSRKLDKYLPKVLHRDDMQEWFDRIDKTNLPVVKGSQEGLQDLIKTHEPVKILVLTARNHMVFNATANWIEKHFPELEVRKGRISSLSMKVDRLTSIDSKKIRLAEYKKRYEVDRVVVVDDDPLAEQLASGQNDLFINVIDCDWSKNQYNTKKQ